MDWDKELQDVVEAAKNLAVAKEHIERKNIT